MNRASITPVLSGLLATYLFAGAKQSDDGFDVKFIYANTDCLSFILYLSNSLSAFLISFFFILRILNCFLDYSEQGIKLFLEVILMSIL